jgi:hypothetical protein
MKRRPFRAALQVLSALKCSRAFRDVLRAVRLRLEVLRTSPSGNVSVLHAMDLHNTDYIAPCADASAAESRGPVQRLQLVRSVDDRIPDCQEVLCINS